MGYTDDRNDEDEQKSSPSSRPSINRNRGNRKNGAPSGRSNIDGPAKRTSGGNAAKEAGASSAKEVGKEAGKEAAKETGKKAAEGGGKLAAGAASTAATGGVPVGLAVEGADAAKKAAEEVGPKAFLDQVQKTASQSEVELKQKKETDTIIKVLAVFLALFLPFIMIFTALTMILNPLSVLSTVAAQYDQREGGKYSIADSTDKEGWKKLISSISNSEGGIVNLFKSIFWNDSEISDRYTIGEWNPDDEYADALWENLDFCELLLQKAYKQAYQEVYDTCSSKGYSEGQIAESLKRNGCDSWQSVYKDTNYAYMISALNLAVYGEDESLDFDIDEYSDILLSEESLSNFYHITYGDPDSQGESSEGDNSETFSVMIEPFDMYDLFAAAGSDMNKKYGDTTTFYDLVIVQVEMLKFETQGNEELAEALHIDSPAPPLSRAHSSGSIGSIGGNYTSVDISGENPTVVWAYLKEAGLSDVQAAALMGNISAESSFSTAMSGDRDSVGICQWRGGRREGLIAHAAKLGLEVTDIHAQASYLINVDFPSRMRGQKAYDRFMGETDLIRATDIICIYFESPQRFRSKAEKDAYDGETYAWSRYAYSEIDGKYHLDLQKRRDHAVTAYVEFAGGE